MSVGGGVQTLGEWVSCSICLQIQYILGVGNLLADSFSKASTGNYKKEIRGNTVREKTARLKMS